MRRDLSHKPPCLRVEDEQGGSAPRLSPCRLCRLSGCQEEKTCWTEARSFSREKGGCRWKNDLLFAPRVSKVWTTALVSLLFRLEQPHVILLLDFCLIPKNIPPGKAAALPECEYGAYSQTRQRLRWVFYLQETERGLVSPHLLLRNCLKMFAEVLGRRSDKSQPFFILQFLHPLMSSALRAAAGCH